MFSVEKEGYKMVVDNSKNVAILSWKPNVSASLYQKSYREALEMLASYNLNRCLIDSGDRENLAHEEDEWEVALLQDEAGAFTSQELQVALVMSEKNYQQVVQNYSLSSSYQNYLPLHINYFTKVEEAMDWLEHVPND